MVTLSAYGLSVDATAGWDGSIYKRRNEGFSNQLGTRDQRDLHAAEYQPIVHLSTLALPVARGDMGGRAPRATTDNKATFFWRQPSGRTNHRRTHTTQPSIARRICSQGPRHHHHFCRASSLIAAIGHFPAEPLFGGCLSPVCTGHRLSQPRPR